MKISQAALQGTGPLMHGAVPTHSAGNGGAVIPAGLPTQPVMSLIDLQMEQSRLVRSIGIALIEPLARPVAEHGAY